LYIKKSGYVNVKRYITINQLSLSRHVFSLPRGSIVSLLLSVLLWMDGWMDGWIHGWMDGGRRRRNGIMR
jgi:hypothetical protein